MNIFTTLEYQHAEAWLSIHNPKLLSLSGLSWPVMMCSDEQSPMGLQVFRHRRAAVMM